jgi:alpha-ribazole phosphatase
MTTTFIAWRHPRPIGHEGRCIGRTDLRVDPRKARRLARRIHAHALRHDSPRVVCTSPLTRCRMVGRCLRRLGWQHLTDSALLESCFGRWDGRAWSSIPPEEIDAWVADFLHHAPGGGERLSELLDRVAAWQPPVAGACVVAHAGWMLSRRWVDDHGPEHPPKHAADWPAPPAYTEAWCFGSVLA